jgi:hypothetical protein
MTSCQDIFENGEILKEANGLKGSCNAQGYDVMRGHIPNRLPVEADFSLVRPVNPGDEVKDRRFAGAVGSDEARDGSPFDIEGYIVDGGQSAEVLGKSLKIEDGHALPSPFSPAGMR